MAATNPRALHTQQIHYLRKTINFNDAGIAAGVLMGTLPAGAQILPFASAITIRTAFNAATTNNLLVGTTAAGNDIVATADAGAGTPGVKTIALATLTTASYRAADTDIFIAYTQTGAVATAGIATVTIAFSVNNDIS
jgi:hypothetical protein